jgi:hypothetical protein
LATFIGGTTLQIISTLAAMVLSISPAFTAPGALRFQQILATWILCPGRRTINAYLEAVLGFNSIALIKQQGYRIKNNRNLAAYWPNG